MQARKVNMHSRWVDTQPVGLGREEGRGPNAASEGQRAVCADQYAARGRSICSNRAGVNPHNPRAGTHMLSGTCKHAW